MDGTGVGQRVLVAPKGEGPEQLTSVCVRVFSIGVGVNGSVRERLAELVLLPPKGALEAGREQSRAGLPAPT